MSGWILVHRSIWEMDFWGSEKFTYGQAWVDIILLANHKRNTFSIRGNLITLERGQFAISEKTLAKRWRWSRGKVERYLGMLKMRRQIEQQTIPQNRFLTTITTITNYEQYQKIEQQTIPQTGQQTGQQTDRRQGRNNKHNKQNEETNVQELFIESEFDRFWIEYPRKEGKGSAEKAWRKVSEELYDIVICAVIKQKVNGCLKNERQYIPLPASWLNGKRWTDEMGGGPTVVLPSDRKL